MKFSSTVDALSKETKNLRWLLLSFGAANVALAIGVLLLYDREPVMVERTARGYEIVNSTPLKRTRHDVEQAARLMLKARLDTDAISPAVWLAPSQGLLRDTEQRELKARSLSQAVIVRGLELSEAAATADIDRVLSVGDVRSALRTKVAFTFESQDPTETNPYGLRLASLIVLPPEKSQQTAAGASAAAGGSSK